MFDEVFGEVTFDYDEYVVQKEIIFLGENKKVDLHIKVEEDETIKPIQRDAYEALMQNWEEMQHKIASAILKYYNEQEKGAYGPDDEDEFAKWWRLPMRTNRGMLGQISGNWKICLEISCFLFQVYV